MNLFTINYTRKTLTVLYQNNTINLDLNNHPIGDFKEPITINNQTKILHFKQENQNSEPTIEIDSEIITNNFQAGNPNTYFK